MNRSLFEAATIRLTALDAKEDAPALAAWTQDSRYIPLRDDAPPFPMSAAQAERKLETLLTEADEKRNSFWFGIRTLDEAELLGIIGLGWVDWSNGAAYMALSMKDLAEYSRPSTEEALALMQHYAFFELHLHHILLTVAAYNEGLIAVLQKLGFAEEVRRRQEIFRFGRRWDNLAFGQLARDWAQDRVEGVRDD
jgi:RimJ/RimL family protein N-acetyltransferase